MKDVKTSKQCADELGCLNNQFTMIINVCQQKQVKETTKENTNKLNGYFRTTRNEK